MRLNDVDPGRASRTGVPEVVLAAGKHDAALVEAVDSLLASHDVLVTRASPSQSALLEREFAPKVRVRGRLSGTLVIGAAGPPPPGRGKVMVITAGAADLAVAEEVIISAEYLGLEAWEVRDCGIAGLHRVQGAVRRVGEERPDVLIVVAGMEGALPSVIASLVSQPVVAIPTSTGYGTGAGGLAAVLTMLNSCVPGVVVVNIDNGFGAAAAAARMLRRS